MNGYTKKHNRLLPTENQMDEIKSAINVSAARVHRSNQVTSFLQIVLVSIQCGRHRMKIYAFFNTETTLSFSYQNVQEKLQSQGNYDKIDIACIHGTDDLKKFP